jgi:hypothetical protein
MTTNDPNGAAGDQFISVRKEDMRRNGAEAS